MDEPEEDCALCGLLLASRDVITLKIKGGIATCNEYAKRRKLDLKFTVSTIKYNFSIGSCNHNSEIE